MCNICSCFSDSVFFLVSGRLTDIADEGDTYPITETTGRLQELDMYMNLMLSEGCDHPVDMTMITDYIGKIKNVQVNNMLYNDEICDSWKTPILLYYEEPFKYTFISCGPNKRFENGMGDDIVKRNY